MKKYPFLALLCLAHTFVYGQASAYKNIWETAPKKVPSGVAVDAPLMGNGDLTMTLGFKSGILSYYLSKNDFWRLQSKADGLSGPRSVGRLDLKIKDFEDALFNAEQELNTGLTTCVLTKGAQRLEVKSWVSATDNKIVIELVANNKSVEVSVDLTALDNDVAELKKGTIGDMQWLSRSFKDGVDIETEVAVAMKSFPNTTNGFVVSTNQSVLLHLAVEGNFKKKNPLEFVSNELKKSGAKSIADLKRKNTDWWNKYWNKSTIELGDSVLMKAYYQGLYTMAACSRDPRFPPGIFGWTTNDSPFWNGDYHLNYNFQAPFYGLYSANRLEQALPHDAPLIDFMDRGYWYSQNVTETRGILYPVGIGPLGIEVTRDFEQYYNGRDVEKGGLFFGQRSNTAYGLLNMAQYWRSTYDENYGRKIYPYALAVANFWEDYLKFENGRYIIYGDAIHEGSGKDKNPILSLGLVRNAFDLILDLSSTLNIDKEKQAKWKDILANLSYFSTQEKNGKTVFRYTEEGTAWWGDNGLGIQHIYPANAITLSSNPELLRISQNTIAEMQRWNDNNTSNSFFVAAIRVGYDPQVVLDRLREYALRSYPNGFDLNNPHGIENSCTVQNALNEMLCMSAGHMIRLFNLPNNQDASFENIRAWGAFLVSAKRSNGVVEYVSIKSEKGKPVTLSNPWGGAKVQLVRNGKKAEILSGNSIEFQTKSNETILIKELI